MSRLIIKSPAKGNPEKDFAIHPEDLAFVDVNSKWVTEPGDFMVKIGDQSAGFTIR